MSCPGSYSNQLHRVRIDLVLQKELLDVKLKFNKAQKHQTAAKRGGHYLGKYICECHPQNLQSNPCALPSAKKAPPGTPCIGSTIW